MTDFPILDAPRTVANAELGRGIFDVFGPIEPYLCELDSWSAMPIRLVHDQAGGWQIECGPYAFGRTDIEVLRAAIASYDRATGPHLRAVPLDTDTTE